MVLEYDANRRGHYDVWHSDVPYMQTPPQASILCAEVIPESGGDTLWANTYLAYDALPDPMKHLAGELHAVHDFARAFRPERFAEYGTQRSATSCTLRPLSNPEKQRAISPMET